MERNINKIEYPYLSTWQAQHVQDKLCEATVNAKVRTRNDNILHAWQNGVVKENSGIIISVY